MLKYHISNNLTDCVKLSYRYRELTESEHNRLYIEIKNATLQGIDDKLADMFKDGDFVKLDNKVNSLLLWVLCLTDNKPNGPQVIKSPGSYCDVDSDFEKGRREDVIDFIKSRYGLDRVCQIATFGTMAAKGSIRNAARALGYPVAAGDKIAKQIPNLPGVTIQDSIDANKEFQDMISKDPEVEHIVNTAKKLEGLVNSIGMHASGVVITDKSATNYFSLMSASRKDADNIISQFEYKDVEANFCLKFDVLGLQTLDIIHKTVDLIKEYRNIDVNIHDIDVNDEGIYKLLNEGHNTGVFQFSSDIFLNAINKIKPQNVDELSDITSLNRPGPIAMGLLDKYVEAKLENKKYDYGLKDQNLIAKVQEICYRSYGLLTYQEQLIRLFVDIAKFNEIEADNARRATAKKRPEELAKLGNIFVSRGTELGYSKECLENLFNQLEGFANYSFNQSHALAYSINSAHTAWLSYYYPLEFHVALLTECSDNADDVRKYIRSAKSRGYNILPPNINKSNLGFIIDGENIVFGLAAIKGIGSAVLKKILKNRPKKGYTSIGHFVTRNIDIINKKILESLTKAGCFVDFHNKETILQSVESILDYISIVKNLDSYSIYDLFKISLSEYIDEVLIKEVDIVDNLSYEIESLGLYITHHPMENYDLISDVVTNIDNISSCDDGDNITIVGAINGIEVKKTKAKTNMANFNIDNGTSSLSCICFSKAYTKYMDIIKEGVVVCANGFLKKTEYGEELCINELSTNIKKYVKEYIKPPPEKIYDISEIEELAGDMIKIKINKNLIYVLEKIKDNNHE